MAVRVLHVVESLQPEAGSVAILLPGLFDALQARGVESEAISLDGAAGFSLRSLVEQADVVHLHGWGNHLARTIARAAHKAARPYLISPHGALGTEAHSRKRRRDKLRSLFGEKRLVRRAVALAALNELEEGELQARRVNCKIVRLPYGVGVKEYEEADTSSGSLPGGSPEGRLLLMLGPIHPAEGFVPLLRALFELGPESDGWNVVLAGRETGDWRKMLEAAVRRKGGDGRVTFAPAPDVATQRTWLARASILAAPSLQVRCPASIMQAIACGVPVLASNRVAPSGLEDVIRVCAPSRGELKAALRSLLGLTDEQRAAVAQRARDAGRALFDWSALVDKYVQLYQDLATGHGPRASGSRLRATDFGRKDHRG